MIRRNIIANVVARAWGVISVYLFVPLYLKFLGIEAYGLVGFYSTLLGVLAFADMGFTATLNREMARLSFQKNSAGTMKNLLRTYESTCLCISSALAVIVWALAPVIAERWLHSAILQQGDMATSIRLMGVAVALQLPSGLYVGGLMGLQRQVQANSIQMMWSAFRGLGAVIVLWLLSPTIFAFASWQVVSNAVYCFVVRSGLWGTLPSTLDEPRPRFEWKVLRDTWHYAASMAALGVLSTMLIQADKVAVSKMLPLEMLGYYSLAGSVASVPLMLAGPVAAAVFPHLAGLVASGDRNGLTHLYHRTSRLVAIVVIPAGLTIALFANEFIFAWTGSPIIAQKTALVASLLIAGQLMQSITIVPYYVALACGDLRLNVQIGIVSVVLITPLLIFLVMKFGFVGAGISWLIMNLCTLPPYMYFLHRRFLPGELHAWVRFDVVRPLLASILVVVLARWLLPSYPSRLLNFCLIGLVWGASVTATLFSMPRLRHELFGVAGKFVEAWQGA